MTNYADAIHSQLHRRYVLSDQAHYQSAIAKWDDVLEREGIQPTPTEVNEKIRRAALYAAEYGETFYWTSDVLTAILGSLDSLPPTTLGSDEQFTTVGWALFEQPVCVPGDEARGSFSGVSWAFRDCGCQVIFTMPSSRDEPLELLLPFTWEYGITQQEVQQNELAPAARISFVNFASVFVAMMLFLQQRVAQLERKQRPRAFRRRRRIDPEPLITVVTLRQQEAVIQAEAQRQSVEWSCRWIVRGHWREQWFPKAATHQPVWVRPYVKGPSEKPIRAARAKLFVVAR